MAESKYAKYIITEPKPDLKLAEYRIRTEDVVPGMETRLLHLDSDVIKGAFYSSCFWFWKGSEVVLVQTHTHDFDEVLGCIGTNPEDAHDLGGEIEFWLNDEKHILTKSCLIFVPKGLKHCPFIVRRVDRPIFHFTTGPTGMYR
jgi:hypothetical protein